MKLYLLPIVLLPAIAGCLGAAPKAPRNWVVDLSAPVSAAASEASAEAPSVKLLQLEVLAPYGGTRLAVLRGDGSIAFDAFNSFAAQPSALLKGAAFDVVESSGVFSRTVRPGSSASADFSLEITVTRIALDCREKGRLDASVALAMTLVGGRKVFSTSRGEASVQVEGGDYSYAFSKSFERAALEALRALKTR